eukprot:scaffold1499_cov255-Pinguiococcus_pyrenoidosus.AAC.25
MTDRTMWTFCSAPPAKAIARSTNKGAFTPPPSQRIACSASAAALGAPEVLNASAAQSASPLSARRTETKLRFELRFGAKNRGSALPKAPKHRSTGL